MVNYLNNLINGNNQKMAVAKKAVAKINGLEAKVSKMEYAQIQERIVQMRTELKALVDLVPESQKLSLTKVERHLPMPASEQKIMNKIQEFLPEVFAFTKEVYGREFGIKHYDVQLLGGFLISQGQRLAEIKTGEGKTMIFNLPLFLYSLVGRGAHLVTANEYLAKRDAEYAGHIASKLGLSVGVVAPGGASFKFVPTEQIEEVKGLDTYNELVALGKPKLANMKGLNLVECTKKEAYECDMSFSVNNELGFDYLRDNMASSIDQISQRELYFCVIDEADSILIDEARTPLIISAQPSDTDVTKYVRFAKAAEQLSEEQGDYTIDYKSRSVLITESGIQKVESYLNVANLWSEFSMAHLLENALKAKAMYLKDQEYIVRGGEVLIVDTFTGRIMDGRRFGEGLHQAIEAKEGVAIQQETITYATITFQNFFRLYKILCGGSGTILTESEEFYKIYSLDSLAVPTHRKVVREDAADRIYSTQEHKFKAVAKEVKERYDKGQPVLVGTTSVEKSELISKYLDMLQVPHEVLNAKYHDREAQIVANAGQKSAVTVATNMAGRGTDIPITDEVKELGGLAVIGTERHESRRIDNQLRGRSGRQGDPGFTRFYVALDDIIMKYLGGDMLKNTVGRMLDEDTPIEMKMISKQIETAQKRVEWANFDSRKNVVEYDDVMSKQREVFYTRRRKVLSLAAKAEQDKQTQEFKDFAWQSLTNYIQEISFPAVTYKKLPAEEAKLLTMKLLELSDPASVASAFDVKQTGIVENLQEIFVGKDYEQVKTTLNNKLLDLYTNKFEELGEQAPTVAKLLTFEAMDKLWMDHLETMNDIRSGIGLQGYAQRNPLVEYKSVGYNQFKELMQEIDKYVAKRILRVVVSPRSTPAAAGPLRLQTNSEEISDINTGDREMLPSQSATQLIQQLSAGQNKLQAAVNNAVQGNTTIKNDPTKKLGRNDPCYCGSGKKYKNCHGA